MYDIAIDRFPGTSALTFTVMGFVVFLVFGNKRKCEVKRLTFVMCYPSPLNSEE